jgi:hypothetical protein
MALTNAEKLKRHREKLKRNGIREIRLKLTPEQAEATKLLGDKLFPTWTVEEMARGVMMLTIHQAGIVIKEKLRLIKAGASQSIADAYVDNEIKRMQPLTAERYLALMKESKQQA